MDEIKEEMSPVLELRKKGVWLMSWAFIQIRYICGHVNPTYYHTTETGLTSGEQAWVWALAEFSHNIPRVGCPFEDFPPPLSLSVRWIDALERLHKLYEEHQSDIIEHKAKDWTKEKICSAIFSEAKAYV